MIAFVKGTLYSISSESVVVETGGVGYQVFVPANVLTKLPAIGSELLLHTFFVVRDVSQTLYGFLSEQDRELFASLLTISGIGPKVARNIIGHMEFSQFSQSIAGNDLRALCRIPGLGKKTAERLLLDMRDKVGALGSPSLAIDSADPETVLIRDAMSALMNLGYAQAVAKKAVEKGLKAVPEANLTELITCSLQEI